MGDGTLVPATLRDVSENGLALTSTPPLPVGATAMLNVPGVADNAKFEVLAATGQRLHCRWQGSIPDRMSTWITGLGVAA
jgi:hypothetical protein